MPEGSSSAAPVMRPGPRSRKNRWKRCLCLGNWRDSLTNVDEGIGEPFPTVFVLSGMRAIQYAGRTLAKSPGFTIVAIATLALGMGVNSAIFSVIDAILLRPLPYPQPDRLISFWEHNPGKTDDRGGVAPANLADYNRNHVFTAVAHAGVKGVNVTGGGTPERMSTLTGTYTLLDVLGVQPALGRTFRADEDRYGAPKVVIVSHQVWQQRFGGDSAVIGRNILLDGEPHQIIGVMPAGFQPPEQFTQREPIQLILPDCWPPDVLAHRGQHFDHARAPVKPVGTI